MADKSTRALAKRELERAVGNLEWVDKHLGWVYAQTVEGSHDALREQLTVLGSAVDEIKKAIERINERM